MASDPFPRAESRDDTEARGYKGCEARSASIALSQAAQRAAIVREALTWERTPYANRGCIKGVAADCAMLPFAVYRAERFIPADTVPPRYSPQWMLHHDEEQYLGWVRRYAREIDRADALPGDFAIWKFGRCYSHGAIVIDLPEVIHAVIKGGGVVRGNVDRDEDLRSRPVKFFTLFGG